MNDYPSPLGQLSRERVFSPAEAVSPGDLIRIADIVNQLRGVTVSVGDREVDLDAAVAAVALYNETLGQKVSYFKWDREQPGKRIDSLEELSTSERQSALESAARHEDYGEATTDDQVEKYIYGEVAK